MAIIVCVDMDAFFASVEQRDDPDLRGKPIAVTGAGERTVVTTSSYEARKYGVKTGMTTFEAKRKCPSLTFVVGNNRKYAEICSQMEEICSRFSADLEIYSIDEVFLDISLSYHLFGNPEDVATKLKQVFKEELGLTCTVGMGPNILVAKLASDLAKPDGFLWIKEEDVPSVFETLPVKKLWGIGKHTEEKLTEMGISTCGALGRTPLFLLTKRFGMVGEHLKEMGNGRLERPLEVVAPDPKSIGHSITLPKDIYKREELTSCLLRLAERVGQRARRYGYEGRTVTLTIRYSDFMTFSRQSVLPIATNDTSEIYKTALAILTKLRLKKSVRLLGISLSSLIKGAHQMSLFDETKIEKKATLMNAVDRINERFGEHSIAFASAFAEKKEQKVISPAWRPKGVRKSDV
jgi:DNA polymerase IV